MKKSIVKSSTKLMGIIAVSATLFASCSSDNNDGENTTTPVVIDPSNFTGSIEKGQEVTLDATKTYILTGKIVVKDGGVLTIDRKSVV